MPLMFAYGGRVQDQLPKCRARPRDLGTAMRGNEIWGIAARDKSILSADQVLDEIINSH